MIGFTSNWFYSFIPRVSSFLFFLIISTFPYSGFAFGLKTHLWIANNIITDVNNDCALRVNNNEYKLIPQYCDSIKEYPTSFLSGALGPDIYPDIIVGQTTTHPGITRGWQTDQWLHHVLRNSQDKNELAFALGYLVHAASDITSHTYVNLYSGDHFVLSDERAVERRHFTLEKYIDAKLPAGLPNANELTVPAAHLRDILIFNDSVAEQYIIAKTAAHLTAMHAMNITVREADKLLEEIEHFLSEAVAKYIAEALELQARVATGEIALDAARETLKANETLLSVQQKAADEAKIAFDKAVAAITKNEEEITEALTLARAKEKALAEAKGIVQSATANAAKAQNKLSDLRTQIANVPRQICRPVTKVINTPVTKTRKECKRVVEKLPWPLDDLVKNVCKTVEFVENVQKTVTETVCKLNDAWANLNKEINKFEKRVTSEQKRAADHAVAVGELTIQMNVAIDRRIAKEAQRAGLAAAKAAAEVTYQTTQASLNAQNDVTKAAREVVEEAEIELEKLRKEIIDKEVIERAITNILDDLNLLTAFTKNWIKGIETSGEEYINTALAVSKSLIDQGENPLSLYKEWLSCYGGSFTVEPYQAAELRCNIETEYSKAKDRVYEITKKLLPPDAREVVEKLEELRDFLEEELRQAALKAGVELVSFVTDETTGDFIGLLANPENATEGKLNEVFALGDETGQKQLLKFSKVSDLINKDLSLGNEGIDPNEFNALRYALTLSRLALLPPKSLNELVRDTAGILGFLFIDRSPFDEDDERFSVLFKAVRSIDGNHQWGPYGLPYPRENGMVPSEVNALKFGYGAQDGPDYGFRLFQDEGLRKYVFLELFPEPIGGAILERKELQHPAYAFPTCDDHPFPVTFDKTGQPLASDLSCLE